MTGSDTYYLPRISLIINKKRKDGIRCDKRRGSGKTNRLEHESKSAKHRLDDLEIQSQAIQDLALSVKEFTINMSSMLAMQEKQGKDIEVMKLAPGEQWSSAKRTAFNTMVGAIAGAFVTGVVYMIAQYIM